MKNTTLSFAAIVGGVLFISAGCVHAQDWPQWRGPNRDGKLSGFTAPAKWPESLAQKWKTTVGLGDSSPALVGDKLYVFARQGDDEVILCLNAADGKGVWTNQYAAPAISGPDASQHPGPRSSPTVSNGKVVTLGVNGVLSCVDAATGKTLWRKDDVLGTPRFHTGLSPIVVDGLCIAHLGKEGDGAVVAYDLATGDQKWKWTGEGPAYASPVVATVAGTKQIVTMTEKSIIGIAVSDGKLLWQTPFTAGGMAYNAATPIVDGSTVVYAGVGRGVNAVKIEKEGDADAIKPLWKNTEVSIQFNTPILKNGLLFGYSARNDFVCISMQDGKTLWTAASTPATEGGGGMAGGMRLPGGGSSSRILATADFGGGMGGGGRGRGGMGGGRTAGYCSIVDAGSVLLALTPASQLIVFQPSDKAYTETARIKVADTPVFASPVISNNRLYVKDQDSVTSWAIQ